jgi:serine/threonine-protein kinase HipA
MHRTVSVVEVRIWGRLVGAVARDPRLDYYAFEYAPEFIASGVELAPLTMPLSAAGNAFIFTDLPTATFQRLPAMLADALPDDFGNGLIDAWMATRGIAKEAITPLDRLAYMGKRGMGALEFRPVRGPTAKSSTAVQLSRLVESARQAIHGELNSDRNASAALKQIIQVGTSAGGARAKGTIAWNPVTLEIRAGLFETEPGFEHWMLKFDGIGTDRELGSTQSYGRIEYAYSLMAQAAGIQMAPCRLLEESGRAHFMTRRFDRDGNQKLHLQSLCALRHLDFKQKATHDYNQYLQTLLELNLGRDDLNEAFRRIAFNVMARNCDDHTKNFAFLLPEGGSWRLAPAYDVTFAYNPKGEWTYQHLMSVNGKFAGITRDDLLTVADRFGIGPAPRILKAVQEAVTAWPDFARAAALSENDVRRIGTEHVLI